MFAVCACVGGVDAQTEPMSRQDLVAQYINALNACDIEQFTSLLHADHSGFAIKGVMGDGMSGEALHTQCASGFALDLRPINTTWLTDESASTQIAGLELTGTISHPVRGTNMNNLRITLVAQREDSGELKVLHTHYSGLR